MTINQPDTRVSWATVRGGSYANTNNRGLLATRSADNFEYNRRTLLKFDTQNAVPAGSVVSSALLTLTVKTGSPDATRRIGVYQVTMTWDPDQVTWNKRKTGYSWSKPGGDLGSLLDQEVVGNAAGTKVTFDVTALVKEAVAGRLGSSRYTRLALIDLDGSTSESYREYVLPNDTNLAARPVLKVVYGGTSTTTAPPVVAPPPPTSTTGTTLRVLHWNIHHNGVGSDGKLDTVRLMKWVASFNADVISLNEVERYNSWGNIDAPVVLANMLKLYSGGKTWYYRFATFTGAANGIGNMILSRFPIDAHASQALSGGRSILDVTINVNGRTVNVSSTHLYPDSSTYRLTEIGELTAWQRSFAQQRIIAGDFNATATSNENAAMKQTYYDSWGVAETNGTAVAYAGNTSGATRNGRIDYIYYSHDASFLVLKSSQVYDTRDANGVTPSDHRPLLSVFTVK